MEKGGKKKKHFKKCLRTRFKYHSVKVGDEGSIQVMAGSSMWYDLNL